MIHFRDFHFGKPHKNGLGREAVEVSEWVRVLRPWVSAKRLFISAADAAVDMHITSKSVFVLPVDMAQLLADENIDGQRETDLSVASDFTQEP